MRLDPATGPCPSCAPASAEPPPDRSAAAAAASPEVTGQQGATFIFEDDEGPPWEADVVWLPSTDGAQGSGPERELGLPLLEAEESLARGDLEKAIVLASKAVKERPDSLPARALHERARRELRRRRRRERVESRVREAERLLEAGDLAGAERIVTSALKLIPNHPVALALFGRLKERRLQADTAEAWAEQELERLTRARARRSLEAAHAKMAAGRERAAMMTVRRGLRIAPDDAELLATLRDIEEAMGRAKAEGAGHHALHAQVRAALVILAQGQIERSLEALRAALRADPDNGPAQVAVQQVRKAWLRRRAAAPAPASEPAVARPVPAVPPAPAPVMSWQAVAAVARASSAIPAPLPSPRTRRRAMPLGLILGCAALLMVVMVVSRRGPQRAPIPAVAAAPPSAARARFDAPPAGTPEPARALAAVEPDLRRAIEAALAAYSRALENADAGLLAEARPDLGAAERDRLLGPFRGALNAATDLRILDVRRHGEQALVPILRTDVIVGGRESSQGPTEETLRFERRSGEWALVSPAGR